MRREYISRAPGRQSGLSGGRRGGRRRRPSADDATPGAVLAVTLDIELSIVTGYAVRKSDGSLGILLINKGEQSFEVAVNLPESPRGVSARRLGRAEYDAGSGPAQLSVRVESRRVTITLPATSMVGLEVR